MTNQEREEWYQDMREEAYQDEIYEKKMRTDFDYFCDVNGEEIEQLNKAVNSLKKQCEAYSYDFDINDFIY